MRHLSHTKIWTLVIAAAVVSVGLALAYYVHSNTTRIRQALAAEVLEQQYDVSALLQEYASVMLTLERSKVSASEENRDRVETAIDIAQKQLELMRSNYSFERLDGAAKAHAFSKPVFEDIEQWMTEGLPGYAPNDPVVITIAAKRAADRFDALRQIAAETDSVATTLIGTQTSYLDRFRKSLIVLLVSFALLSLGIAALLIRQRDLQTQLANNQKRHAQRFRDFADVGADLFWEMNESLELNNLSGGDRQRSTHQSRQKLDDSTVSENPASSESSFFDSSNASDVQWPMEQLRKLVPFNDIESHWISRDGSKRILSISGKPLTGEDGRFLGYRGIGRDITARKLMESELELANQSLIDAQTRGREQAEEALQDSEKFLRTSLNALPSRIAIINSHGNIIAVNTAWRQLAESANDQFKDGGIDTHYTKIYQALTGENATDTLNATTHIQQVLTGVDSHTNFDYPCHTDNEERWLVVSASSFNASNERYVVLVHEDVTERRELEEKDRRRRAELAHIARHTTAGELASGLAHELNQPLTAISHNCDALVSMVQQQPVTDTEMVETAQDINDQAHRAGGIIRSMRQLVRRGTVDPIPVDFNNLVRETVRLTTPEAREHGIAVQLNLADNLPEPVIDPVQFQQVLVNLERNAVEAIGQGVSNIRSLSISTMLQTPTLIKITIEDSGPGFDPIIEDQLFTAFSTTKEDGMGLGLSISRSIVEAHGGRLWADRSDRNTTRFHFTIPVDKQ